MARVMLVWGVGWSLPVLVGNQADSAGMVNGYPRRYIREQMVQFGVPGCTQALNVYRIGRLMRMYGTVRDTR